jgi:hypothetical protein
MIRHYSRILVEAAQLRALRDIYKSDPHLGPTSASTFLHFLASRRDSAADKSDDDSFPLSH